ncbi:discoidin domain-containing protein [Capnocytophaga genosp. AHN8471]|uniref:glycoside hydrolase family 2 TIM barrel-domain containing protein n=1 Tax=Capnocytophaga genosp. AHN8471 TaxID=327574 RepID=UPI00193419F9|nr:glycoside hydrolase family 2 TIM barrel-domain containing protein [Capnocytophaga genosp. AHN8471]MBM0654489.1 discoidin domain-containing protein [Capnocytophaga genosp. AHN8471]
MKNYFLAFTLAATISATAQHKTLAGFAYGNPAAPTGDEWQSPENLSLNKEYPRAYFFSFNNEKQATQVLPEYAPYWQSLNGQWQFHWCKTPEQRPKDFYKTDYDTSKWDAIPVPSNWNVYGIQKNGSLKYGLPIYVNQPVIFYHERKIDDWRKGVMRTPPTDWTTYDYRNEVGSYVREFEVPNNWDGREIFIDFDGVDSFFYLWINGKYVGFSKNSRNVASFDITPYLQKGKNKVAVEVYRNSDGSFLESQDMFRLPGIFRTVALRATPKVQIFNLNILTDTKDENLWQLNINTEVRNLSAKTAKHYQLRYVMYEVALYEDDVIPTAVQTQTSLSVLTPKTLGKTTTTIAVKNPKLWSAEAPHRYVLVAQLLDKKGKVIETVSSYFGFRKVEIKDKVYYLNGQPIKLKGVNRHETHPAQGHTLTHEQMQEDLFLMKRNNINHVRNSHYPPDPYWFYLCDKYGIYLENEANIESHEYHYGKESLSHPKEWENAHVARVTEMVEATYNAPSVVIWSLGNEAGPGDNFKAAYNHLKTIDKSRPVQYERNNSIVDMGSNQYPSVAWVEKAATGELDIKYPFHISEYAHSMGNAMGNLADYWKAIDSSNYICGGAIWDWVDQSIYNYTKNGIRYEGYGGDFGDYPNDGQFVMNGLIFADRKPKPQLAEVKKVYQEVAVSKYTPFLKEDIMSPPIFEIFNKNYFRTLSHLKGVWKLYKNGFEIKKGNFSIDAIPPQKSDRVNIGYLPKEDADYYINFEFELAEDMPWAKKGFVQAAEQLRWTEKKVEKSPIASVAKGEKLTLSKDQKTLAGKDFSVQFDFEKGTIAKLQYGEQSIVENSDFQLNAFRAFLNNDVWAYQQWFAKGLHNLQHKALSHKVTKNANGSYSFAFTVQSQAPNGAQLVGKPSAADHHIEEFTNKPFNNDDFRFVTNQVFTVYPDGSIELQAAIASNVPTAILPQIGYQLKLPKKFRYATYYGRGPQDNYSDRKTGAFVGIYNDEVTSPLPEGGSSFPKPQDMGHHQDTRWVALKNDGSKIGVLLVANPTMDFSALAHSPQQLTLAGHPYQLPESDATYLQLSAATTGVGGNSCGPTPLIRDRVTASPTHFGFIIRPIKVHISGTDENEKIAAQAQVSPSTPAPAFVTNLEKDKSVQMKVIFASSEEVGLGEATHLLDNDPSTIWHSAYSVTVAKYPHWVDFELLKETLITGISYLPRSDEYKTGDVKDFSVSVSNDGQHWEEIYKGTFPLKDGRPQKAIFAKPVKARYLRFTALSEQYGQDYVSGAELQILSKTP